MDADDHDVQQHEYRHKEYPLAHRRRLTRPVYEMLEHVSNCPRYEHRSAHMREMCRSGHYLWFESL